jgi:hypothetical protein
MEATLKQIETTTADSEELKEKQVSEATRELASFELSLVGGGFGQASFV